MLQQPTANDPQWHGTCSIDLVMGQERIAVTVWGDRISPVLDVSNRALLLTVQDGGTSDYVELALPDGGSAKFSVLAGRGVRTILCGAVSGALAEQAAAFGLQLIAFLAGEVEQVVAAYVAGQLPQPSLAMPGCRGWRRGRRSGRCRSGFPTTGLEGVMPQGDGTGSQGKGPGTGRGQRPCQGGPKPGATRPGGGTGRGGGAGQQQGKGKGPGRGAGPQK
jgi:hypothetical protein